MNNSNSDVNCRKYARKEVDRVKYDEELYIDSGIYGYEEEGMSCRKEKIVKCRKAHKCASCGKKIIKGEQVISESGFLDGKAVSCHTCLDCIEEWLEESGLIDDEIEED